MAIPIGLIINELMTNSLKHAFPDQKTGEIKVDFRRHNGKEFRLSVSDSGIGMPENFNFREATSLGLQLVNTLADQLRGRLELYSEQGTRFEITFAQYKK
jgi:two-component sensor histidine kinase